MPFQKIDKRETSLTAVYGTLIATQFRASPTIAELDVIAAEQRKLVAERGHVSQLIVIYTSAISKVSDEVKQRGIEMERNLGDKHLGAATIVVGKGLTATIVRSILAGYDLLSQSVISRKTFSKVGDGVLWLRDLPKQPVDVKTLTPAEVISFFELPADA